MRIRRILIVFSVAANAVITANAFSNPSPIDLLATKFEKEELQNGFILRFPVSGNYGAIDPINLGGDAAQQSKVITEYIERVSLSVGFPQNLEFHVTRVKQGGSVRFHQTVNGVPVSPSKLNFDNDLIVKYMLLVAGTPLRDI